MHELAEDQAVELTFVFQGIDDDPLLRERLQLLAAVSSEIRTLESTFRTSQ